jgi:hypothetical protein
MQTPSTPPKKMLLKFPARVVKASRKARFSKIFKDLSNNRQEMTRPLQPLQSPTSKSDSPPTVIVKDNGADHSAEFAKVLEELIEKRRKVTRSMQGQLTMDKLSRPLVAKHLLSLERNRFEKAVEQAKQAEVKGRSEATA